MTYKLLQPWKVLNGIFFVLRTGFQFKVLPRSMKQLAASMGISANSRKLSFIASVGGNIVKYVAHIQHRGKNKGYNPKFKAQR